MLSQNKVYLNEAYVKSDLIIKSTPLNPTVCIETIQARSCEILIKRMQLTAIILGGAESVSNLL